MNSTKPKLFSWLILPFLMVFVMLMPAGRALAYTYSYTAYDFGLDASSNNWQVWYANGSNVYNWAQNYVGGYLHYTFTIQDYGGGFYCSASCRGLFVYDKNPTTGFETSDIITNEGIGAPQNNMNNHTYAVDIQFNATGYHESVYDNNTATEYSDADVAITVTPSTYITFAWNGTSGLGGGGGLGTESPSDHAASFMSTGYAFPSGQGGGGDIYTTALPIEGTGGGGSSACSGGTIGTCIGSVTPKGDAPPWSNAEATSTTFAFGATGYVSATDFASGTYVEVKYQPNDYDQLAAVECAIGGCFTTFNFPVSASGAWTFSTSTDIERQGTYTLITNLKTPYQLFGVTVPFFFNNAVSTSTQFLVATSSQLDILKQAIGDAYQQAGITNAGIANVTSYCTFSSLSDLFNLSQKNNLFTCVLGAISVLTVPTASELAGFGANLQNSFLARVPFGYVTRFTVIASTVATSSLPTLAISLPNGFPGAGESFDLTPWNALMGTTSMLSTATSTQSGKTLRQIVEPGWDIFVLACLGLAIVHRVLGFDQESSTSKV